MDRKIYINPHKRGGENISKSVHINRNFGKPTSTSSQINSSNGYIIHPHINPLFHKNQLPNSCTIDIDSGKNKIYVNPKIMGVLDINFLSNPLPRSDVVSKNRFKKINHPQTEIDLPVPKDNLINSNSNLAIAPIPSRVCRSLVRKKVNPTIIDRSKSTFISKSKYKIIKIDRKPDIINCNLKLIEKPCDRKRLSLQNLKKVELHKSRRKIINKKINTSLSNLKKSLNILKLTSSTNNIVYVGNEKYILYENVLRRLNSRTVRPVAKQKIVKQICINGKTFIRKSENLFEEREKPSSKLLKKNNIPCPVYRKLGVCIKNQKGKCVFVHDPKHVAICRKYLTGACKLEGCFLSHDISLEKMPTCKFFLEGCCSREDCPYLHVKINEDSRICVQFLQGFCATGKDCNDMHINVCPDFYKYSKCSKPKCPYPHKIVNTKIPQFSNCSNSSIGNTNIKKIDNTCNSKLNNISNNSNIDIPRYFLKNTSNLCKESRNDSPNKLPAVDDIESTGSQQSGIHNRPKLGILPSFIAL